MEVIQVATLVTPDGAYGGPLRVAVNQTRALLEANHDVTLVAGAMGYKGALPETFDGVPVRLFRAYQPIPQLGFAGITSPALLKWLSKSARSADVIHIHVGRDLVTLPSALISSRSGTPYFLQTHGMIDASAKLLAKPLDQYLTRPVLKKAEKIFFLTDHERRALHELVPGLANLLELQNGVPRSSSHRHSPPGQDIEVLFLARLQARKRPSAFVDMAKRLQNKFPAVNFVLVGPDEGEGPAVTSAIREAGMGHRLKWEGSVSPEESAERIAKCSIYVLPSIDEPFPMSVLEAMSLGKPVVVTDTCGLAKPVTLAGAGCVVGPELSELVSAVEFLLANPDRMIDAGNKALELSRQAFGMDKIIQRLTTAYSDAVTENMSS